MQHVAERSDRSAELRSGRETFLSEWKLREPGVHAVEYGVGGRVPHVGNPCLHDRACAHQTWLERRGKHQILGRPKWEHRQRIHLTMRERRRRQDAWFDPLLEHPVTSYGHDPPG